MDPRVPLLRTQLLKAQRDALRWSESSAQWKASADRRLVREQEHMNKCGELERELEQIKKELEQTRKRQREDKEEFQRDLERKRTALMNIMMGDTEQ